MAPLDRRSHARLLATVLLAAFSVLAGAVAAPPATAAESRATDPTGDAAPPSADGAGDLRAATVADAKGGRLRFAVVTAPAAEPWVLVVDIRVGRRLFQVRGDRVYRVAGFGIEGVEARETGMANVRRRGDRTTISFPRTAIGGPRALRWRVRSLIGLEPVDSLPDAGFERHVSASAAPAVRGPDRVSPGRRVRLRARGFPARQPLRVTLQPTANRGGNGFGIAIRRSFRTDGRGRALLRFRFPRRYLGCAGADDCTSLRWRKGARVDANVCTASGSADFQCARRVVRVVRP